MSLLTLPSEVLELIISFLDHQSSISTLGTCTTIFDKVSESIWFWRHVCHSLCLHSQEWQMSARNGSHQSCVRYWRSLYKRWKHTETRLKRNNSVWSCDRLYIDLDSVGRENRQEVVTLPNLGYQEADQFGTFRSEKILPTIFSLTMSELYMVLILSSCQTYKSHVAVWDISSTPSFSFSLSPLFNTYHVLVNIWLACSEDVIVYRNILIIMGSKANPSNFFDGKGSTSDPNLIHMFDLSSSLCKLVAIYSLVPPNTRFLPLILKDGGGSKLMIVDKFLVAVCPEVEREYYTTQHETEPIFVIRVFDLTLLETEEENGVIDLDPFFSWQVPDVKLRQPFSFMLSDQSGPNIVMSFNKNVEEKGWLNQQFLVLTLESKKSIKTSVFSEGQGLKKVPKLMLDQEDDRRREECLLAAGDIPGVFILMDAGGLITTRDRNGLMRQFYSVYGICDDWDTFYDEVHLYQSKVIVMKTYKNRELGRAGGKSKLTVVSVSSMEGQLLWKVDVGPAAAGKLGRLYLGTMFGKVIVADNRSLVVYCLDNGQLINKIQYYKYKRQSKELESDQPDASPYCQTGHSVWEVRRLGDRLVVVHDVERLNPLIADIFSIVESI